MSGPAEVTRFRALLADRLGWTFAENDDPQLARVLDRRAEQAGLGTLTYLRRLGAGPWPAELTALVEDLSITETYFFRHAEQFRALTEVVLPERVHARSDQRVLRMLSVGCSSGEEAYTLAIVAREARPNADWETSVIGLDANPVVLQRAARACYSGWSLRETPDVVRQRWFHPHDNGFELDAAVRADVSFRQYNVADEDPVLWRAEQYDVVFCRNLLMYLTPATATALVQRMTRALRPGGYLFLGHTDTLGSNPDGLEPQHTHHTFYYRRHTAAVPPRPVAPAAPGPTLPATADAPATRPAAADPAVRERALRLLHAERFAEALTVVEAGMPDRPQPPDLLLQGVLLAQGGRVEDAETVARRLIDLDGLYADAHHLLGVCLDQGAAVDVAIGHYRLAAYLDPQFAMPRLRLGLLARRRGDHRTAAGQLEPALNLLRRERADRIELFGGGFGRISLVALCRTELDACGAAR